MATLRLTLRQLQIFAAVAEHGSTAAAGAGIGLSQSATSAALNELERLLSRQLFDRAGKRLLLNDHGRALLPQARALLDGAAEIERSAGGDGDGDAPPPLRIGASTTIGNYLLPRALGSYLRRWYVPGAAADWHAQVTIGNTAEICTAVARFELDLGLIEGPCDTPELDARPWLADELVIVAAPALARQLAADAGGAPHLPLALLRQQVWLLREAGSGTRVATDLALLPHLRAYRRSIEMGSSEANKHAVADGLGLACMSEWVVADDLASGRLVRIRTPLPRMVRQCYRVLHRRKQPTPALQRLIAHLDAAVR
ncbi:LysR family transcriptional regulator [Pseudorhodoferax sp.]|uniref:LysR family transcriptional regulator n=1 Tax=Pseudorhodoferax sp. TaxID=1993553 RepID=UPI0039E69407